MSCGFWPLVHSLEYPWSSQSFPFERTAITVTNKFHFFDIHGRIFFCLLFAVGCNNRLRTFGDLYCLKIGRVQVLPAQHVHARAGNLQQNSLSSCCVTDGAGRHHSLVGEKNVALSFSLSFKIFLASLHASPRAHRSCPPVSSWDLSSNFEAYGLRWWRTLTRIFPSDGPLFSRMFAWRCVAFVNRTRRVGSKTFVLFPEINIESGGSASCDTQPNCRTLFTIATALLSPPFFGLLLGWSSTFHCGIEHSAPNFHPVPDLELTFGKMSIVTR